MKPALKHQLTLPLFTDENGLCACGCGRITRIVGGKRLKYFRASHHPNHKPNRESKETSQPRPTLCACGCGRAVRITAGKHLKYSLSSHCLYRESKEISQPRPKSKKGQMKYVPTGPPDLPPPFRVSESDAASAGRLDAIIQRLETSPDYTREARRWLGSVSMKGKREYMTGRRENDPAFKLLTNLRGRISAALKGAGKSKETLQLVGCSIAELRLHLARKFKPGMNWENYGQWHVDHIIPCCSFDLILEEEQLRCFHFSNLQPLWADENFKKSGKHPGNANRAHDGRECQETDR